MTWAIVQWSPARFVPVEQLDEELEAAPPDLQLTPTVDDEGRAGVWWFLGGPDVVVGFDDELSARVYADAEGMGDVFVTDESARWVERATFVHDVQRSG